jgi:hypothetical protein
MLSMIRDYLIMVLAKIIVGAFFGGLVLFGFFILYWIFRDYATAATTMKATLTCDAAKFFSLLLLVGCFLHTAEYKSAPKKSEFNTCKYLDKVFFEHDTGSKMY